MLFYIAFYWVDFCSLSFIHIFMCLFFFIRLKMRFNFIWKWHISKLNELLMNISKATTWHDFVHQTVLCTIFFFSKENTFSTLNSLETIYVVPLLKWHYRCDLLWPFLTGKYQNMHDDQKLFVWKWWNSSEKKKIKITLLLNTFCGFCALAIFTFHKQYCDGYTIHFQYINFCLTAS